MIDDNHYTATTPVPPVPFFFVHPWNFSSLPRLLRYVDGSIWFAGPLYELIVQLIFTSQRSLTCLYLLLLLEETNQKSRLSQAAISSFPKLKNKCFFDRDIFWKSCLVLAQREITVQHWCSFIVVCDVDFSTSNGGVLSRFKSPGQITRLFFERRPFEGDKLQNVFVSNNN